MANLYMCKTLILTGWGWKEYPVSAAVVLKALGGDADVAGMSRRRLPEFLESYDGKSKRIIIIGVSLSGDEPRLAAVLARLKRRNLLKKRRQISCISLRRIMAFQTVISESQPDYSCIS